MQLFRSSTAIGANYEEARGAESRIDFAHKMKISLKEARELAYWLQFMIQSKMDNSSEVVELLKECQEICDILAKSIKTLQQNVKIKNLQLSIYNENSPNQLKSHNQNIDHLGSSTFLSDINGHPYEFFLYLPFGETMAQQNAAGWETPYKFTGKELDDVTGLYYFGARYYDPHISLWMSVDPLAEKYPGWSPYNYTLNNPLKFVDPDGNSAICPTCPQMKEYEKYIKSEHYYVYSPGGKVYENEISHYNPKPKFRPASLLLFAPPGIKELTKIVENSVEDAYIYAKGLSKGRGDAIPHLWDDEVTIKGSEEGIDRATSGFSVLMSPF